VVLDQLGLGAVSFDGTDGAGLNLGPGLYWAMVHGGGISDRRGFMIKRPGRP